MPIVQFPLNNGYQAPQNSVFYESVGGGDTDTTGSLSWTHNSAGGPTCCVVMTYSLYYSGSTPTFGFNFGGQALTNLGGVNLITGTNVMFTGIAYKLGGIPSGSSAVTATLTGGTIHDFEANTFAFQNVGGFPASNNSSSTATGTSATCSLAAPPGCMSLGVICPDGVAMSGITYPFQWNDGLFNSIASIIPHTTANPTAILSATLTTSAPWGEVLFSMAPPVFTVSTVGPLGRGFSTAIPRASTR